ELELRLRCDRPFIFEGATLVVSSSDAPIWRPRIEAVDSANISQFAKLLRDRGEDMDESFPSLHRWSVDNPERFWSEIWNLAGLDRSDRGDVILEANGGMFGAKWFPNATLNYAKVLLGRGSSGQPAVVSWNESGRQRSWSFAELKDQTARLAHSLKAMGVQKS